MTHGPQPKCDLATSRPVRRSLRLSLMAWFMGIALLPLIAMGTVGFLKARAARQDEIRHNLAVLAANEKAGMADFISHAAGELTYQSRLSANLDFLGRLAADLTTSRLAPRPWTRSSRWHALTNDVGQELIRFRNSSPWHDILLLNAAGVVVFSCRQADDLGADLTSGPYAHSDFANAVRAAAASQELVLSPFDEYAPAGRQAVAFLVAPMTGANGTNLGAMVFCLRSEELAATAAVRHVVGDGATAYLVDSELRLVTRPRGVESLAVLTDRVVNAATTAWRDGLGEHVGGDLLTYPGPTGELMLGNCTTIEVMGQRLGLVTEIPQAVAMAGLAQIRLAMLIMVAFTALMVILAGQFISHRVVHPLVALGQVMKRVTEGHEVRDLNVAGHNEVGDLADQFATMIGHLNEAEQARDYQFQLQRAQFELNEKMRGEPDTRTLAAAILDYIGDYYGAQVGAFYLAKPGGLLVLAASLGDAGAGGPVAELREGQGVVGRVAWRRRIEVLRDIPADHVQIRTAVGQSSPRTLVLAPFHLQGQIKGVMELGTVREVPDEDLEFLRLSAESVAVALDSCRSRERVQRLLGETRRQASALAHQQRELQDSNARLARSDRYKSEFLANMSHELRTPLNSMMLMSQVLAENRRGVLNDDEVEAAGTIHHAGGDLLTIIDDILDMSKVEAGKLELSPEQVGLVDLVSDLKQLFQPVADRKGLDFRTHIGPGVPDTVFTDGLRLKQILKNLLNNACKFTDSGSVVLRVRQPSQGELDQRDGCRAGSCLAISVADTGIGMSPETVAQVFEAFNQGDGTIGRCFGGSGLGLSISRRLTELLQGDLQATSAEGKGSKFTLFLPLSATFEADPEPDKPLVKVVEPLPDAGFLSGYQLILADDEMRTVYRLGDELGALGLDARVVRTVPALLRQMATLPDRSLVLVNPWCGRRGPDGPGGAALLRRLRQALNGAPVPLVALVPPDCHEDLSAADAVVNKPTNIARVIDACAGVLIPQGVSA